MQVGGCDGMVVHMDLHNVLCQTAHAGNRVRLSWGAAACPCFHPDIWTNDTFPFYIGQVHANDPAVAGHDLHAAVRSSISVQTPARHAAHAEARVLSLGCSSVRLMAWNGKHIFGGMLRVVELRTCCSADPAAQQRAAQGPATTPPWTRPVWPSTGRARPVQSCTFKPLERAQCTSRLARLRP